MNGKTVLSVLAAGVLIFATAACDFSPSSPFEGFEEAQRNGATLNGQFQQAATSSSRQSVALGYSAQRASTTSNNEELTATEVIVYDADGTEIGSVDIDGDGSFTLRGLPGYFTLVFVDASGKPLGEPMEFEGVKPNQEIDIVVGMLGGEVTLLEESRTGIDHEGSSGIEIEGIAENIVIDSPPDMMTGSLDVNGYHVLTRVAETSIRKGNRSLTLEDLQDGDQVHVRGVFEGDDVFAFEIKLQEEEEDDDTPQTACTSWDPEKPDKILVCHNGRTLSISPDAWPAHEGHGDECGPC